MIDRRDGLVTTELRDGVLDVVLNRPEARNAIDDATEEAFYAVLDEAEMDPDVKAVMLRGAGPVFSAGHDLKVHQPWPSLFPHTRPSTGLTLPRPWYFRKPLIGGVHSFVGPYALVYVACCDFTIAADGTRFSCEALRLGSQHPYGPWALLYMQLPMRVVAKLFLMAGWMDAQEALQHQFVQRVVPPDELEAETRRWALEAAKMSSPRYAESKLALRRVYETWGLSWMGQVPGAATGAAFETGFDDATSLAEVGERWRKLLEEKGMREAVRLRDAEFDVDVGRI